MKLNSGDLYISTHPCRVNLLRDITSYNECNVTPGGEMTHESFTISMSGAFMYGGVIYKGKCYMISMGAIPWNERSV